MLSNGIVSAFCLGSGTGTAWEPNLHHTFFKYVYLAPSLIRGLKIYENRVQKEYLNNKFAK